MTSRFAFAACQPGAESALKAEVEARVPTWRFAYSRPGFVTFKLPKEVEVASFEPPRLAFARTVGLSLDRMTGETDAAALAQRLWAHDGVRALLGSGSVALHVWQRDAALPGEDGVEPGPTPLSAAVYEAIRAAAPDGALGASGGETPDPDPASDTAPAPGARRVRVALDVAILEPSEWWVGAHAIRSRTDRWVGGAPRLTLPEHAVSRAYLKLQEALRWSALPARRGDTWVELGCAPGGASQALLDAGMRVVGVDPAEVDEALLAEKRFTHVRARSAEAPKSAFAGAKWLAADINAAPAYTLAAVEPLVADPESRFRGVLLTLKLLGPDLARPEKIREVVATVRGWGFGDIRVRQLAFNRREYCLAALRSRAQRRVSRTSSRRRREDQSRASRRSTAPPSTRVKPSDS